LDWLAEKYEEQAEKRKKGDLKMVKLRLFLILLLAAFGLGLVRADVQAEAGGGIRIIPVLTSQRLKNGGGFEYKIKPGRQKKVRVTLVNLLGREVGGYLRLAGDGSDGKMLAKAVKPIKIKLAPKQRKNLEVLIKMEAAAAEREYVGSWQVADGDGNVLGQAPVSLIAGDNLELDFKIISAGLIKVDKGLGLEVKFKNTGASSLRRTQVDLKYKNRWWWGLVNEESFAVAEKIKPGAVGVIKKTVSPPRGLMGPVDVDLTVMAGGKKDSRSWSFFYWPLGRLLWWAGWLIVIGVGVGLAFKFIFKGMAGILYGYLKEKAGKRGRHRSREADSEIVDLLRVDSYPQLLLDVRRIVREEMEINRRLMVAEMEKSVLIKMLKSQKSKGKRQKLKNVKS